DGVDEDGAVAVDDLATRRRDIERARVVALRLLGVRLAVEHLEEPEAEEDDGEHHQRDAADDGHPHGQLRTHRGSPVIRALDHRRTPLTGRRSSAAHPAATTAVTAG